MQIKLTEVVDEHITIEGNYMFADIFLSSEIGVVDKFLIDLFESFRVMNMEKRDQRCIAMSIEIKQRSFSSQ